MCGIVAGSGRTPIIALLIEGLKKLEYRGYDSAGLAVVSTRGEIKRLRSVGRVCELEAQVNGEIAGTLFFTGIAHTRWATHGVPSERNAHPHIAGSGSKALAIVHNGIIENFASLRAELLAAGIAFASETDTEVVAHLIERALQAEPDLLKAVCAVCRRLTGAYAIAVIRAAEPQRVIVARDGAPLLLGLGETGHYAASDAAALLQVTRRMVYLENGDVAELTPQSYRIVNHAGAPQQRPVALSQLSADAVELGRFKHYMQKEIFEQPDALANTLEMADSVKSVQVGLFGAAAAAIFPTVDSVTILACGTSFHAGLVARNWLEAIAGLPCSVEIASEYRYRAAASSRQRLVVAISQSGETADTLAALEYAKKQGAAATLALCNVPESALVQVCDLRFITRAGPEIGVASTKAFTTQLAALYLLTLALAKSQGRLTAPAEEAALTALRHLPAALSQVLLLEPAIQHWAQRLASKQHALFLGRGLHFPIALEGALKLKEISYIHAEGYAAGELKHGPLALVDADMPVVSVAPNDKLLDKLKSNLEVVRSRGGELFVFADADCEFHDTANIHILRLPEHYGDLSPLLHVVPLQLLAYHTALLRGADVDKPRNLAKSVTVE